VGGDPAAAGLLALARADQGGLQLLLRLGGDRLRGRWGGSPVVRGARLEPPGPPAGVDADQGGADVEGVALGGVELDHRAGVGGGDLDHRLGRLHLHDRLVEGDGLALGDQPAHHLALCEPFAEVGELELALGHLGRSSS
jgi:hypothetical protein